MPNVMPAATWDRLQAKADEVDGVRSGALFEYAAGKPACLAGIACATGDIPVKNLDRLKHEGFENDDELQLIVSKTIELFGVGTPFDVLLTLDRAIDTVRKRRYPDPLSAEHHGSLKRVPFADVMAELQITRGET